MSAPKDAKPIGDPICDIKGKPLPKSQWPKIKCHCGWRGCVTELLGVDPDIDKTMWCPHCGSIGWEYR